MQKTLKERFDDKWICSMGGCFEWLGARSGSPGRASIHVSNKTVRASHVAWFLKTGNWPEKGVSVLHKCDNPGCVRFDHLFLGSQGDNVQDCIKKERRGDFKGPKNGRVKLSEGDVSFIRNNVRKSGDKSRIARFLGVWPSTIGNIIAGKSWNYAQPEQ